MNLRTKYLKLLRNYRKLRERYAELLESMETMKRIYEKRLEETKEKERQKLILEFVKLVDDMDRAMLFVKQSKDDNLKKGVEMIYSKMLQFLRSMGVEQFSAKGKPFDPNLHEAMMVKEGEEDNVVVEEFEKGYIYKGKLLKPAKVVVSKKSS